MPNARCEQSGLRSPTGCSSAGNGTCARSWTNTPHITTSSARTGPGICGHRPAAVAQARVAGDPVVLREALGNDGFLAALAGEPDAGDQLRAAVRLPALDDMPSPYWAPETHLAMWHLWRGDLD